MDDQDRDQQHELDSPLTEIAEEQATRQEMVPFLGDELAAAMTAAGNIYITLPGICKALGLNVSGQTQRIRRTSSLAKALRLIPLQTRGGLQRITCLRVDRVALWLAGVETSRLKPEYRGRIESYQDELAPVAMQVFMRAMGMQVSQLVSPAADPRVTQISEQIDTLSGVVTLLREHLTALLSLPGQVEGLSLQLTEAISMLESLAVRQDAAETQIEQIDARTQRLTPAHAREVQVMVDGIVRETKRLPQPLTYANIYGRLKHHFRVGSYSEVADSRFDALMGYLRDELRRATSGETPEQGSLF